uniref:Regulator of G-protein signaling 5 n=1 Tax=Monodelphis domestica TaxID=13616 RepID=A0A5F8GWG1_MONDO
MRSYWEIILSGFFSCRAKEIKTKLGTLLQKPDATIDLIIPYPDKPEKPVKTQKPSPEEALQWRDSLEKLLQNNYGLASFKSFLKSEFSEENIEFWIACEDYKKTKSPIKMAEKAKKIYEEFIRAEAPKEVNIDHFTKAMTMKNLVEPSPSSFDMAQKRIHALMEKDSLPRFIRSEFYQELIKSLLTLEMFQILWTLLLIGQSQKKVPRASMLTSFLDLHLTLQTFAT